MIAELRFVGAVMRLACPVTRLTHRGSMAA